MSDSPKIAVIGAGHWGKNLVSNLIGQGNSLRFDRVDESFRNDLPIESALVISILF